VQLIQSYGSEAIFIKADVSKVEEIRQLFDENLAKFGKLDILVSNAGLEHFGKFEEVTQEEFDATFAVNTRGQFFTMQEAAKRMTHRGRLICMSSVSTMRGFPNHAVYAGSKAANEGFVRNLAVDLGPRGITVNAIAPGATKTDMYEKFAHLYGESGSSVEEQMKKLSPLGRVGKPEDIGNIVAFLVSDEGGWLTGQIIHATGGMA